MVERVGFLLDEVFPMLSLSGMADVMQITNYVADKPLYEWVSVATKKTPLKAANGFAILPDHTLRSVGQLDRLVICSQRGYDFTDEAVLSWLRKLARGTTAIGSVATGTWILAKAGLLTGKRCTIHWEDFGAFREVFPDIELTQNLFEVEGGIFTCSGATAAIDLFLSFVANTHGIDLARAVADEFLHARIRKQREKQADERAFFNILRSDIRQAAKLMEGTIEAPLPISEIARRVGLSERHFSRQFRRTFGQTPKTYFLILRLNHAAALLSRTSMSVTEIALACGFAGGASFSAAFRNRFGHSPREYRSI